MKIPDQITVRVTDIPAFSALLEALAVWEQFYGDIDVWDAANRGMTQLDHGSEEYEARIDVIDAARKLAGKS